MGSAKAKTGAMEVAMEKRMDHEVTETMMDQPATEVETTPKRQLRALHHKGPPLEVHCHAQHQRASKRLALTLDANVLQSPACPLVPYYERIVLGWKRLESHHQRSKVGLRICAAVGVVNSAFLPLPNPNLLPSAASHKIYYQVRHSCFERAEILVVPTRPVDNIES